MPIGVIDYDRPKNLATTPTELEAEFRVTTTTANAIKTEWFLTLDPNNVAQVSTVTITAGTTADFYAIQVTVGTDVHTYRHKQIASETATSIAAFLATLINTNANVQAQSSGNIITITSLIPAQAFVLSNADSTTVGNVVFATTTPNSGTVLHRKIADATLTFTANPAGFPSVNVSGNWYDGGLVPVLKQSFGPLVGTGNSTIDAIQTAQGVNRPIT
ncbi:MAG: hypothetical protein HWQ38_08020 [Nostoc sp. NMS7]|uniref:hypothetical protein n=1 Tax=Nostoc sp. NMS7 TaxID=2815391 RepID=UPI0025DC5F49|nr:hypothetical protein [Nostoc sp. NMS7]MBN3946428.1 hypothetical protein [Nostoc sp. NMS7]